MRTSSCFALLALLSSPALFIVARPAPQSDTDVTSQIESIVSVITSAIDSISSDLSTIVVDKRQIVDDILLDVAEPIVTGVASPLSDSGIEGGLKARGESVAVVVTSANKRQLTDPTSIVDGLTSSIAVPTSIIGDLPVAKRQGITDLGLVLTSLPTPTIIDDL